MKEIKRLLLVIGVCIALLVQLFVFTFFINRVPSLAYNHGKAVTIVESPNRRYEVKVFVDDEGALGYGPVTVYAKDNEGILFMNVREIYDKLPDDSSNVDPYNPKISWINNHELKIYGSTVDIQSPKTYVNE